MAKIKYGPMVGQASGSVAATVFSRNRYGSYTRNRAIPISVTSPAAQAQKALMTQVSQAWQSLSTAERLSWESWAATHPITDRLGDAQILAPSTAFQMINMRALQAGGSGVSAPPVGTPPSGVLTLTPSGDIGAGDFNLAYTATPLGASEVLYIWAAVVSSPGIKYVRNLFKLVTVTGVAQASPYDPQTDIEARFGPLQVGQIVHYEVQVVDQDTGLASGRFPTQVAVTST